MPFYNLFVTIRSVDQQRNSLPKTRIRRLATECARVDKLPDYLESETKAVNQRQKIHFP